MDILLIALLIIAGIVLLLIELFLVPGFGVMGIAAGGCILYANYYAFTEMGLLAGCVTLLISAIAVIGSVIWFMKSKTLDRISLKKNITSKIDKSAEENMKIGNIGITTTRLALIGYADINGQIVEVKSSDGFIDEKCPVKVIRITDGIVLVEKLKHT